MIESDLGVYPRRTNIEVGEEFFIHKIAVGVRNSRQTTVGQTWYDHTSGGRLCFHELYVSPLARLPNKDSQNDDYGSADATKQ